MDFSALIRHRLELIAIRLHNASCNSAKSAIHFQRTGDKSSFYKIISEQNNNKYIIYLHVPVSHLYFVVALISPAALHSDEKIKMYISLWQKRFQRSTIANSQFTISVFIFTFSLLLVRPFLPPPAVVRFRLTHSAAEFYLRFSNGKSRTRETIAPLLSVEL